MNKFSSQIVIASIVLSAFIWGYKKDVIHGAFASLGKEPEAAAPAVDLAATESESTQPPEPALPLPTLRPRPVAVKTPRVAKPQTKTLPPISAGGNTLPANPYQALADKMAERSRNSPMAETFDSIRRNQVDQQQVLQKNAYFRKLSEQLKELRGENQKATQTPPAVPGAPAVGGSPERKPPRDPALPALADPESEAALVDDELPPDAALDELSEEEQLADELDQLLETENDLIDEALQ